MQDQVRRSGIVGGNFYVLPANPTAPSGLQCLEHRFFRGKAGGIMLRGHRAAAVAIGTLTWSENAFTKARRAQQHFANPTNFDNVYTDGDDHN